MYLNEHKVSKMSDAALMADEFVLTHQISVNHFNDLSRSKMSVTVIPKKITVSSFADNTSHMKAEMVCFYCKKPGHKISDCIALKKKEKGVKPVCLISTSNVNHTPARFNEQIERVDITEMESVKNSVDFAPFLTEGTVALPNSDETVPVRILRDTGAGQSFLLEGLLPLSERTDTGTHVLVRGLEMGFMEVPLHRIHLKSKLVSGEVVVGVRAMLPVSGVTFIIGNDLAGGNVWEKSDAGVPPIVASAVEKLDGSCVCPNLYPACAITRAMAKKSMPDETENILCDTFIVLENSSQPEKKYCVYRCGRCDPCA